MISGRVQRFGSDINTDYIIAAQHKAASLDVSGDGTTHLRGHRS